MEITVISPGEAYMMPYWWAYTYNVVVTDRDRFLSWIKEGASKIWESLSRSDRNHTHRESKKPGHVQIGWGFWADDSESS
jgi:hypothetical protein